MNAYHIALFLHLASLLVACTAAALAFHGSLGLRKARDAAEAGRWLRFVGRVVKLFPVSVLGLLATGAYMTQVRWSWSLPWIQASATGLGLIVVLGSGIEAARARALGRELAANGLTPRARRLQSDPVSWSAKMMTLTVALSVVLVMTTKPGAAGAIEALATALAVGFVAAVPFWRAAPGVSSAGAREPGAVQVDQALGGVVEVEG